MSTVLDQEVQTIDIHKEIEIAAPIEIAFQAMLDEMGPESMMGDGTPMPMKLEAWPGGRWFRDLGNNNGHFWGTVQVIKAPTLIFCGKDELPPFQDAAHWLHQNIKGARLEWLSPAKHASVLEQPQEFAARTRAFLKS